MNIFKQKKLILPFLLLIFSTFFLFSAPQQNIFADTTDTIIYPVYNDGKRIFQDLTNINKFDINEKFLVYSTSKTDTLPCTITVINLNTKQLETKSFAADEDIAYIKCTTNYFFVSVKNTVSASTELFAYKYHGEQVYLSESSSTNFEFLNFVQISIFENKAENRIYIGRIKDNFFECHWFNNSTLRHINHYEFNDILDETLQLTITNTHAYIINGEQENSLITLDFSSQEKNDSYFPTADVLSMAYTKVKVGDTVSDYIISATSSHLKIAKKIEESVNPSIEKHDDTRGGETLKVNGSFLVGDICNPTDVKINIINNKPHIFVSDKITKSIQLFTLVVDAENKCKFEEEDIIVASRSGAEGWLNNNSTATYHNNTLFVTDTKNSRIQIFYELDDEIIEHNFAANYTHLSPPQVMSNSVFVTAKNKISNNFELLSFSKNDQTYSLNSNFPITYAITTTGNLAISNALDMIAHDNLLFVLDKNLGLLQLDDTSLVQLSIAGESILFADDAKLGYLPQTRTLLIYNAGTLYQLKFTSSNTLSVQHTTPTTDSFDQVFSLCNDEIDNTFIFGQKEGVKTIVKYSQLPLIHEKELTNSNFYVYSTISIDKSSGIIYGFNNTNCVFESIVNPAFNLIVTPAKVLAINPTVNIYNKPELKEDNIVKKLFIHSTTNVLTKNTVSFGGQLFYVTLLPDETYGYINSNDVILDNGTFVKPLLKFNAFIRFEENTTALPVYDENSKTSYVISSLKNNQKIYVLEWGSANELTFVRFYNDDLEIMYGYIETEFIKTNDLTHTEITALIIMSVTILITVAIVFIYKKIKKKNTQN